MYTDYRDVLAFLDLTVQDLNDVFGNNTVKRGISYFNADKILELSSVKVDGETGEQLTASALVEGSQYQRYKTNIRIEFTPFGTSVSSHCSCPVTYDCKHGVATLLVFGHFLKQRLEKEPEVDEVDAWLNLLEVQQSVPDEQHALQNMFAQDIQREKTYDVVYLLGFNVDEPVNNENPGLYVRAVKARKLKKGGYGQIYYFDHGYITEGYSFYEQSLDYNEYDVEILHNLKAMPRAGYQINTKIFLQGDIGFLILLKILETGRAFWKSQKSEALSGGQDRELQLAWNEEEAVYTPGFSATPDIDELFYLDESTGVYLDKTLSQMGRITQQTLTSQQLRTFLLAPPIPLERAREFSEKLLTVAPEVNFPLPVDIDLETREIEVAPQIHLSLSEVKHPHDENQKTHVAGLHFVYDRHDIKPVHASHLENSVFIYIKDKCRYQIHRDLTIENKALQRMCGYGFITSPFHQSSISDWVLAATSQEESLWCWEHFLEQIIPELENEGWVIEWDESFSLNFETIDDWYADVEEQEGNDWFSFNLGFEFNGEMVNLLPLIVRLLHQYPDVEMLHQVLEQQEYQLLHVKDGQYVKMPSQRIRHILDTIIELYDHDALDDNGNLSFSQYNALQLGDLLNDPKLQWQGADEIKALSQKIKDFSGIESVELPDGLTADLRDYQKKGVNWLQFLRSFNFNGILADDMGLGKTVQALTNLLFEKEQGRAARPSLVIAPTSLMSNWKNEAAKFTPSLKVLVLQGSDRSDKFSQIEEHDLILSTYPLMVRDKEIYKEQKFHYVILDEAQAIKNAKAKTTQAIYQLEANHRLCITGTPLENHLGEIWSIFHFLMPGFLSTHERFNRLFRNPIEKNSDLARGNQLKERINPFLLRRTKDVVATELPEKSEILRTVALQGKQRDLYETVRLAMDKKVRDEISNKGLARSQIMILDALLKLRQVCCDPQLVRLDKARKVKESAKFDLLMSLVPEMVSEGRKILIFSQFTTMLGIIEHALKERKITYTKLTGRTRKREEAITRFQEGDAKVFLISLKAGGVGLNLTAADTVIHYDPWWNPAVEKQATDRAYRIGQDKPVFVYKLVTEETVEEKILKMQEKKQALADSLYGAKGDEKGSNAIEQAELLELLKPLD